MRRKFYQAAQTGNNALSNTGVTKMATLSTKQGSTRGKNPRKIEYQAFDLEKPDTLPKSLKEFVDVTKANENELLDYAIDGFNSAQYSAASDEIGEFINDAWDKDTQAQFRLIVRNYAKAANKSIEDAAALMTPAIQAGFESRQAAAKAEAAKTPA